MQEKFMEMSEIHWENMFYPSVKLILEVCSVFPHENSFTYFYYIDLNTLYKLK